MTSVTLLGVPADDDLEGLAALLVDCVDGGASVNFLRPLPHADALAWWRQALTDPHTVTWVARDGLGVVGCVRLTLAQQQNGGHRGEVGKMLVVRRARGNGVARLLLTALEAWARQHGRHRLVLDTEEGSVAADVYARLGWIRVGTIPDYALDTDGHLAAATFFTRSLLP